MTGNHQELLARLDHVATEIRFAKTQQWRTVYYALFFFSAVIAISRLSKQLDIILIIAAAFLVLVVTAMAWVYEGHHAKALTRYRAQGAAIEKLIAWYTKNNLKRKIDALSIQLEPSIENYIKLDLKGRRTGTIGWYTGVFIGIIAIGGFVTIGLLLQRWPLVQEWFHKILNCLT